MRQKRAADGRPAWTTTWTLRLWSMFIFLFGLERVLAEVLLPFLRGARTDSIGDLLVESLGELLLRRTVMLVPHV